MNATFLGRFAAHGRRLACLLATIGVAVVPANPVNAQTLAGLALDRLELELRELHHLVYRLERDEYKARTERKQLIKQRSDALKFVGGNWHQSYRFAFMASFQKNLLSPEQASLLQMYVPAVPAGDFRPEPNVGFPGGDVHELVRFCLDQKVNLRIGSKAQLVVNELARDVSNAIEQRIAELDEKIEDLKSQNIAHTDVLGKLILARAHCHHCAHCYYYGYGCCGYAPVIVLETPPAGMNSKAYDRTLHRSQPDKRSVTSTSGERLKFLEAPVYTKPQPSQIGD